MIAYRFFRRVESRNLSYMITAEKYILREIIISRLSTVFTQIIEHEVALNAIVRVGTERSFR